MKELQFSPGLLRLLIWSGAFLVACWIVALVGGGFIPPDSPSSSARSITDFYADNELRLRIATVVLMVTGSFWATWGAVIAVLVRRMERGWPLLTFTTVALVGGGYVFFECVALFWGVAAFRPGELDPQTTLTLHDLGWFAMLFDWPPFALFNVVIAIAILKDRGVPTVFPRWVAWVCLWCAFIFTPAGAIIFAKTGPFAYNGLLALYIPLTVFFFWMCVMTYAMLQATGRLARQQAAAEPGIPAGRVREREPEPTIA